MIVSWLSTVRVIRIFSSAAAAIRISSPTAMAKIFNPIGKRMAPPPSGTQPVAGMGRPARYVADYSGTALRRCSRRAISSDIYRIVDSDASPGQGASGRRGCAVSGAHTTAIERVADQDVEAPTTTSAVAPGRAGTALEPPGTAPCPAATASKRG